MSYGDSSQRGETRRCDCFQRSSNVAARSTRSRSLSPSRGETRRYGCFSRPSDSDARSTQSRSLSPLSGERVGVRGKRRSKARALRRHSTDAEHALWFRLRDRRLSGLKFRRQHPIGRYYADFACPECRLVVELDGGQHAYQEKYDRRRSEYLQRRGWRVVRFWDDEVLTEVETVLEVILRRAQAPSITTLWTRDGHRTHSAPAIGPRDFSPGPRRP
ncbi:MAG TPA: endonuclease domain-containing protein [Casimicrobiaceae bacterium]|nr:endonuclease domain-containing protein [Casimicrobiaceae bacterium]